MNKHAWKIGGFLGNFFTKFKKLTKLEKSKNLFPEYLIFHRYESAYPAWQGSRRKGEGRKGATTRRLNYVPDANTGVLSGAAGVLHPSFSFLENSAHEIRGFASVHTLNTTRASEFDARRPSPLFLSPRLDAVISVPSFSFSFGASRIDRRSRLEIQTPRTWPLNGSRSSNKIQKQLFILKR